MEYAQPTAVCRSQIRTFFFRWCRAAWSMLPCWGCLSRKSRSTSSLCVLLFTGRQTGNQTEVLVYAVYVLCFAFLSARSIIENDLPGARVLVLMFFASLRFLIESSVFAWQHEVHSRVTTKELNLECSFAVSAIICVVRLRSQRTCRRRQLLRGCCRCVAQSVVPFLLRSVSNLLCLFF